MKKKQNYEVKHKDIKITNGEAEFKVSKIWPTLQLDVDYFQSYLDEDNLSDSHKRELLETIWNIVVAFVDLGFSVEPVQQATKTDENNPQDTVRKEPDFVQDSRFADKLDCISTAACKKKIIQQEDTYDV